MKWLYAWTSMQTPPHWTPSTTSDYSYLKPIFLISTITGTLQKQPQLHTNAELLLSTPSMGPHKLPRQPIIYHTVNLPPWPATIGHWESTSMLAFSSAIGYLPQYSRFNEESTAMHIQRYQNFARPSYRNAKHTTYSNESPNWLNSTILLVDYKICQYRRP